MNIKEKIWNEKYRPQTIEECILPNSVKKTFEDYLIAGNCTNIMLHSTSGGTGKCLGPDEELELLVYEERVLNHFINYVVKKDTPIIKITLKQLFDYYNHITYYELLEITDRVYVRTPTHWVALEGIILKIDNLVKVSFETGDSFICGQKHIVPTDKGDCFVNEATNVYNYTLDKFVKITSKEYLGINTVYDIAIEFPHYYMTPNGFVHHNTTILKALCNELDYELLFINASEQRSIDVLRNDVTQFVSTLSIDGRNKAVLFDEFCLEENEKVIVGTTLNWKSISLKDLEVGVVYPIVSVNINNFKLENDTGEIISERIEEVYEVKLEDERTIIVTEEHPFFVYDCGNINEVSILDGLSKDDFVLTYSFYIPEFTKIKSITKIGERKVRNLVVYKNHNFITENGIVTHNCNSQAITQNALRGFIEQYSKVKFFFSCNYIDKIIPQLLSRCTVIPFNWKSDDKVLKTNFFKRIKYILEAESVPFKKEVVVELINRYFPDFRRVVNELQTYSITGSIDEGLLNYTKELDLSDLFESIKKKNFTDVRQWVEVNDNMSYELFYRNFYRDLKLVAADNCLPNMILLMGQYQFRHNSVMDKQINTLAFLIEVMAEIKFK